MDKLVNEIKLSLDEFQDKQRQILAQHYYPTKLMVIGVKVPDIKRIAKEIKVQVLKLSHKQIIELSHKLIYTGIFECYQVAYELYNHNNNLIHSLCENDIDILSEKIDNWVLVDSLGCYITGAAWRMNIIPDTKIYSYIKSNNLWIKRLGIVSTIPLNLRSRGGSGDPKRTLEICKMVIDDHRNLIVKAVSWALRELVKSNKEDVIQFLEIYEEKLHALVKREVKNKIITGKKNIT